MRKLLGHLIWLGFVIVAAPFILGVAVALLRWLFLGLATVIALAVVGVALAAALALLS